jgi:flagellar basal-body rod protein FlgB
MLDPIGNELGRYMDLLSARQKLVTANIANVDTPGYRTQDIDFQAEMQSATVGAKPAAVQPGVTTVKTDGNDVSLDRESRLLAENALRFNMASNLMKAHLRMVKTAIQESR